MSESQIQDAIRLELGKRPDLIVCWRNNIGHAVMRHGHRVTFGVGGPGGADLLGLTHRGQFVAIEVKTPKGRQTPEQMAFQSLVTRLGGVYLLMRSVDDAREFLESL
jgi:hypothetical protein